MKRINLCGEWSLSGYGISGEISAVVPGCVHTDMYRAGLINDPLYRDNNKYNFPIEEGDYIYEREFSVDKLEGAVLVFEGLDTYADIYLNGVLLGESHNMFIPHEFSVCGVLRTGVNRLSVRFRSPVREVEGRPKRNGAFTTERMYTRRVQCTYSWDWVDRFVTMGIFLPVYIEYRSGVELRDVYVYTAGIDGFGAHIICDMELRGVEAAGAMAHIEILSPSGAVACSTSFYADRERVRREFNLKNPQLWYPNGYGEHPLYTLVITVGENRYEESFGIRTLRIVEDVDEVGSEYDKLAKIMQKKRHGVVYDKNERHSGFMVVVNGEPIYMVGGNFVPCEPFASEESDEKIEKLVKMASEMGANALRVWGGGYFERDSFYSACDKEGILVLQDFLMACGEYPEDEDWFIEELRLEAEHAARRLRNHPSLAFWQGDNENATEGSDTLESYTGRRSALFGLEPVVARLDPARRFLPSSPYGGDTYGSVTVGTTHTTNFVGGIFEYFDTSDFLDYKEVLGGFTARFISEEGVFGGISRASLLRFMTRTDVEDESEYMLIYHTKGNPALKKEIFEYNTKYAKGVLGEPQSTEERLFKYAYAQYEWVRLAFENARRNIGYNNGIIFWMFNDCWPAALGWSFVDYYLRPKASYYCFKRFAGALSASVTEQDGEYVLHVSSEKLGLSGVEYTAYQYAIEDKDAPIAVINGFVGDVEKRSSLAISLPLSVDPGSIIYVDVTASEGSDRCFYKSGRLTLKESEKLSYTLDGNMLTVTAGELVHAVEIDTELIPEDNYFTLLGGESRTLCLKNGVWEPTGYPLAVRGYSVDFDD